MQLKQKPIFALLFFVCNYFALFANQGDNQLKVTVIDEQGEPLVGVIVTIPEKTFSDVTDGAGQVLLKDVDQKDEIHFYYTGYQEVKVSSSHIRTAGNTIEMRPDPKLLETVVVVGRRNDKAGEIPYLVERIGAEDIAFSNTQTAADALQNHAGIFVQKSQMGGGSPVIRGFEANRVLLVLDGVRLNNAIYRNGHLQNAITVDNAMLNQMEVIYGPGSLMYGSDALGGVVHFRSKDPQLFYGADENGKNSLTMANFYTRYATANQEKSVHADVNIGGRKWAFLTSMSFSDFGDLRAGHHRPVAYPEFGKRYYYVDRINDTDQVLANDNPDLQRHTGYHQLDLMQKIRFQPNHKLYFIANFQYSTTSDIPRYDNLTELSGDTPRDLKFSEWYYGPQNRALGSLKARLLQKTAWYDKATIIGAFQYIEEDRFERRLKKDWRESSLVDVAVYSLTADFDKDIDKLARHRLSYGLDMSHNEVASEAFQTNLIDGMRRDDINSRYPSQGSSMSALGSYLNYRWRNLDSTLIYNAGLRYTRTLLSAQFGKGDPIQWPAIYVNGINANNGALTWATGLTYNSVSKWQFRILAATGFRSPNIDDFAKIRENGGFVTIPNPELKPEKSFTSELTIAKAWGNFSGDTGIKLSATGFYTQLSNAIVRENFQMPNGASYFISNGDSLFVQANVNADKAHIYGLSGNLLFQLHEHWELQSSINYTRGRRTFTKKDANGFVQLDTLVPQDHIPPLYGRTSIAFAKGKFRLEGVIRYNGKKAVEDYAVGAITIDGKALPLIDREGTADNIELGIRDPQTGDYKGVYGWTTLNFYSSYEITPNFTLNFAVENIGDVHYRSFASGLSAPGRNFIFALRGGF